MIGLESDPSFPIIFDTFTDVQEPSRWNWIDEDLSSYRPSDWNDDPAFGSNTQNTYDFIEYLYSGSIFDPQRDESSWVKSSGNFLGIDYPQVGA